MIIVADASVLVAELLRKRGRELIAHPDLRVVVAEDQWAETQPRLEARLAVLIGRGRLDEEQADELRRAITGLLEGHVIDVVPRAAYQDHEVVARERIPRDPDDWPTVALAIVLEAGILTGDEDFLGCGCPTWTAETLAAELRRLSAAGQ
jgi:predicted nucleic acid-binding protein